MVQLPATKCSCIAILWVSLGSFTAITLCVASQQVIQTVSVYFVMDSVRKLLDTPSYAAHTTWRCVCTCHHTNSKDKIQHSLVTNIAQKYFTRSPCYFLYKKCLHKSFSLSKANHHTTYYEPTLNVANMCPTAEVHTVYMLVMLMAKLRCQNVQVSNDTTFILGFTIISRVLSITMMSVQEQNGQAQSLL
jgi:hypothetical protein